jgi:hypothetical protein
MSKNTLEKFHEATASAYTNENRVVDYDEAHTAIGSAPVRTIGEKTQEAKHHKETMSKIQEKEKVNHPDHYNKGIETIDYIESWNMNFAQGNVVKYVSRYAMKGGLEDLKKAQWYLERLIELEEKNV